MIGGMRVKGREPGDKEGRQNIDRRSVGLRKLPRNIALNDFANIPPLKVALGEHDQRRHPVAHRV